MSSAVLRRTFLVIVKDYFFDRNRYFLTGIM